MESKREGGVCVCKRETERALSFISDMLVSELQFVAIVATLANHPFCIMCLIPCSHETALHTVHMCVGAGLGRADWDHGADFSEQWE